MVQKHVTADWSGSPRDRSFLRPLVSDRFWEESSLQWPHEQNYTQYFSEVQDLREPIRSRFDKVISSGLSLGSKLTREMYRLLVQVSLAKDDLTGLYCIIQQEDYYQFEVCLNEWIQMRFWNRVQDLANLVVPPLAGVIMYAKWFGTLASNWNTSLFQLFGFWRPVTVKENHDKSDWLQLPSQGSL